MGSLYTAGTVPSADFFNQYYGSSDTAQTVVTGTGPATLSTVYTIPANEPIVGSAYELTCGGSGTWGNPAQALTFTLELQGTVICANITIASGAFNTSAGFRWRLSADYCCSATGTNGKFYGGYAATLTQAANPVLPGTVADNTVGIADANATGVTIDTTSAMFAKVAVGFASNAGGPTITNVRTIFRKVA